MIIVTGATGSLGHAVVEQLLKRIPAEEIGVSVRDVSKARHLDDRGVRVRQGDFEDTEKLLHAFEGASQVFIVSSGTLGAAGVRHHQNAIDTAKKSGAKRVLYTSHMGVSPLSKFPPMPHHAATEEMLTASGMPFTSLRNGYYASSLLRLISGAVHTGELRFPEDGPFAWTTHADLAEAAAIILTEQSFDGFTPQLTASEAIDKEGIAAMVSDILGRPIRRVVISEEEYREQLQAQGFSDFYLDITLGMFRASREGDFAQTSPALTDLLGRSPQHVKDYLSVSLAQTPNR